MAALDIEKVRREGLAFDWERLLAQGGEALSLEDRYRLKMWGVCAQRHPGFFMIRHRIFGGRLSWDQLETLARCAGRFASGFLHLTSRQNIELHSVRLEDVPKLFEEERKVGITTRSSCGFTFRNVLGSVCAGVCPEEIVDTRPWVEHFSHLIVEHSDYYNHRLPKRLNVSFTGCAACDDPSLFNDIGFQATRREGKAGFALWVGGSLGSAPKPGVLLFDFLPLEQVVPAAAAVARFYLLHGDRQTPAKGRLKFLLEKTGEEAFRREIETLLQDFQPQEGEFGCLKPPLPAREPERDGKLKGSPLRDLPPGVFPQRQFGFYRVRLGVVLGECHFEKALALAAWVRENAVREVVLTPDQNFEVQGVPGDRVADLLRKAKKWGFEVEEAGKLLDVQTCPGTAFCSLAITGAQGAGRSLRQYFLEKKHHQNPLLRELRVHLSGCPHSCARHQAAHIGFSGGMTRVGEEQRFAYQLYLGGKPGPREYRAGERVKNAVADEMVVPVTDALFTVFFRDREHRESFEAFVERLGPKEVARRLDEVLVERGLSPVTYNRVGVEPAYVEEKEGG